MRLNAMVIKPSITSLLKETDDGDVRSVNANLLNKILDRFEAFVNPEVLVVPRKRL